MRNFKKAIIFAYIIYFVLPIQFISLFNPGKAEAASVSITSRIDFETGTKDQTETVSKEGDLKLQPAGWLKKPDQLLQCLECQLVLG